MLPGLAWPHLQSTRLQPPFFSTGLPHLGQGLVLAANQLRVSLHTNQHSGQSFNISKSNNPLKSLLLQQQVLYTTHETQGSSAVLQCGIVIITTAAGLAAALAAPAADSIKYAVTAKQL